MGQIVNEKPITGLTAPAFPARGGQLLAVPGRITVRGVLKVTAKYYGMALDELMSGCRTQPLVRRRRVAMYVAYGKATAYSSRRGRRSGTGGVSTKVASLEDRRAKLAALARSK